MNIFGRALKGPSPGLVKAGDGGFVRLVDSHTVYGGAMAFPELVRRLVKPETKYLVLDLDGTFHRNLNLGVYLGYELCAYQAYGLDYLLRVEPKRGRSPVIIKRRDHLGRARYASVGARRWLVPGAIYYSLARLGWTSQAIRRNLRYSLGPFAMDRLLALMRLGLMHQMAGADLGDVKLLVESLWRRYSDLAVIEPEDLAEIRRDFPGLKIIVSSASPSVCLDVVREKYPVHDVINFEIETRNGRTSTPHLVHPLFGLERPARIAPPASLRENAAQMKIDRLVERYPDFLDPDVHTVGVSDTKHGEDLSFAEAFKCVADVNSPDPFSPVVSALSPLREIHSARVLTQKERREGPRGNSAPEGRTFSADKLSSLLETEFAEAQKCAARCYGLYHGASEELADFAEKMDLLETETAGAVDSYNASPGRRKSAALRSLRTSNRRMAENNRRLSGSLHGLSDAWSDLEASLSAARGKVHGKAGGGSRPVKGGRL